MQTEISELEEFIERYTSMSESEFAERISKLDKPALITVTTAMFAVAKTGCKLELSARKLVGFHRQSEERINALEAELPPPAFLQKGSTHV